MLSRKKSDMANPLNIEGVAMKLCFGNAFKNNVSPLNKVRQNLKFQQSAIGQDLAMLLEGGVHPH